MTEGLAKRLARRALGALGYSIRHVGRGVNGVQLLHDACILLGNRHAPILFDVGANIGQTTQAMLEAFRSPQIWAFEPSPSTFESLCRAVGDRDGVTVEPLAMGDSAGTLTFHVTRDYSVSDSLLAPTWNAGGSTTAVPVDTIDGYCDRRGIKSIDLLKIDAQGYDLRVLTGARRMLDARRITLYSCEAIFTPMYHGQATLPELLEYAAGVGYELIGFYEQTYVRSRLTCLDALFLSSGSRRSACDRAE